MGIGISEVLIVVVIALVVFGAYRRLPALGRSAGAGVRKGGERAKQLSGQVRKKAEGVDTAGIGESVGKGLREAREARDSVKGLGTDQPAKQTGRERADGPGGPERSQRD